MYVLVCCIWKKKIEIQVDILFHRIFLLPILENAKWKKFYFFLGFFYLCNCLVNMQRVEAMYDFFFFSSFFYLRNIYLKHFTILITMKITIFITVFVRLFVMRPQSTNQLVVDACSCDVFFCVLFSLSLFLLLLLPFLFVCGSTEN